MKRAIFCVATAFFLLFAVVYFNDQYFNDPPENEIIIIRLEQQSIIDSHKQRAKRLLTTLREGTSTPIVDLMTLMGDLEQSSLTPEDIGTTEDELEKMRVAGFKQKATEYLNKLRASKSKLLFNFLHLKSYLEGGNLTPEDIGTTEAELELLACEDCMEI